MSACNVAAAAALLSLLLASAQQVEPREGGAHRRLGRHRAAELRTERQLDNLTGDVVLGPRNRSCFIVTGGTNCVNNRNCEADHGPSTYCGMDGKCRCMPGYCSDGRGRCSREENRLVAGPFDLHNARYPRAQLFLLSNGLDALTEDESDRIRFHAVPGGGYAVLSNDEASALCCTELHDLDQQRHCVFAGFDITEAEAPLCVFDLYRAPPFKGRPEGAVALEAWALRQAPLVLEAPLFEHPSNGVISSYQGENYGANSYWLASPEIPASLLKAFPGPECTSDCGAYDSGHGSRAREQFLRHFGAAIYGLLWWAVVTALYAYWRRGERPSWDPKLTQVEEAQDWSSGVWDCHRDCSGCWLACCCPAIRWADTMSDAGIHSFWYAFVVYTLGGIITLLPWLSPLDAVLATMDRDELRRHLKIQRRENQCTVCLLFFCCQACMVAQEGRHVDELVGKAAMVAAARQP